MASKTKSRMSLGQNISIWIILNALMNCVSSEHGHLGVIAANDEVLSNLQTNEAFEEVEDCGQVQNASNWG